MMADCSLGGEERNSKAIGTADVASAGAVEGRWSAASLLTPVTIDCDAGDVDTVTNGDAVDDDDKEDGDCAIVVNG